MKKRRLKRLWQKIKWFYRGALKNKRRPPLGQEDLIPPEDVARRFNVTIKTLSQWRWNSRGPDFKTVGRQIWYEEAAVKRFEKKWIKPHTSYRGN